MSETASVLDAALLRHIGATLPPFEFDVTRNDIRKYAYATGQQEARFLSGDEAPLMFLFGAMMPIVPLGQLLPDGRQPDNALIPPLPLTRIMAGGSRFEVHGVVRAGDTLIVHQKLADLYEKQGSEGPLLFLIFENRFETRDGALVVLERLTRIAR